MATLFHRVILPRVPSYKNLSYISARERSYILKSKGTRRNHLEKHPANSKLAVKLRRILFSDIIFTLETVQTSHAPLKWYSPKGNTDQLQTDKTVGLNRQYRIKDP